MMVVDGQFRARKDAGYTFDCQHGPRECQGNMMHACGIEYSTNTTQAIQYAVCLMRSLNNSEKVAIPIPSATTLELSS